MIHKLNFSITIKADDSKIWKALWDDTNYRAWAGIFFEGSYVSAENWKEGNKVHFLAPGQNGIYSNIENLIPNKKIVFKHIGNVLNGEEQPIDDEIQKWSGAKEMYSIIEGPDKDRLLNIEIDVLDEHKDFMTQKFPLALKKIKENAEK